MKRFSQKVGHLIDGSLRQRYQRADKLKFHRSQTQTFIQLITPGYKDVLDVGCGHGYFSFVGALEKKFTNCYGCDIEDNYQIGELQPLVSKVEYQPITNNHLPYPKNKFNLTFSMDVIEHVKDDLGQIREMIRVTKKGDTIIIGTPNRTRIANRWLQLIGQLNFPHGEGAGAHQREYTINQLVTKVVKASDQQIDQDTIEVIPCWLGILPINLGIHPVPSIFVNFCHFFFIKFKKTWS